MLLSHQELSGQSKKGNDQKKISKSKPPVSGSVRKTADPSEGHDADTQIPFLAGLNPVSQVRPATDTLEVPVTAESMIPDTQSDQEGNVPEAPGVTESVNLDKVRVKNFDSFLGKLSKVFHRACSKDMQEPMPEEVISALYHGIYTGLPEEEKMGITSQFETVVINALSRTPRCDLAETFTGLSSASQVSPAIDTLEAPVAAEPMIPDTSSDQEENIQDESGTTELDEARVGNVDSFLMKLSEVFHRACSKDIQEPMPEEVISALYRGIYTGIPEEEKVGISPQLETAVINALRRTPRYFLAEKDPDHTGKDDVPDIGELLALDAYLQAYEPENPEGASSEIHSGYHRGNSGQPDFVYRDEMERTLKSYDPLKLPREDSPEDWLGGAFNHHAGGKNTGSVCILNVSDATSQMLADWKQSFQVKLEAIKAQLDAHKDMESQHANLIQLCNTYVVSYGENAEEPPSGAPEENLVITLQKIFDDARDYLQGKPFLQQLEDWRRESSRPMDFSDIFAQMYGM